MDESLYQKVKSAAKAQHRSVNSFINEVLEGAVASAIPKLEPEEYRPSAELLEFGMLLEGATEEKDKLDPKARYILSK